MNDFIFKNGDLYCEELRVADIAEKVGTPFYLYSRNTLVSHLKAVDEAFGDIEHLICFSVKANSNLAILRMMASQGAGADVVSGGELYRARKAGVDPKRIVYAGLGKTAAEIEYALNEGILMFNVESSEELMLINEVAVKLDKVAPIALRVNPDIDPGTHPYIATGLKQSKFGIPLTEAMAEYEVAHKLAGLMPIGIHQHIGSQILESGPFENSVKKVANLAGSLKALGMDIGYINIGGGFGIQYTDEEAPAPEEFARAVVPLLSDTGCTLLMEVGRMIAGNAGILVTSVLFNKQGEEKRFVVVDAAMNDLIRPSLYQATHKITPALSRDDATQVKVDVVGPICESGDFLGKDVELPSVEQGDLLAVFTAGAYGFTMSSNYNSRTRVPEILVSERKAFVIRRRETYEDLIRGEAIPDGF